jgi:hypothetical protein
LVYDASICAIVLHRPIGYLMVLLRMDKRLPNTLFLAKKIDRVMGSFFKYCAAFCSVFPAKWGGKLPASAQIKSATM